MKIPELLASKALKTATLTRATAALTTSGGPNYYRLRVSLKTEDFNFLYSTLGTAIAARSIIHGSVEKGLVIELTTNSGVAIAQQSRATVALATSVKDVDAAQNKTPSQSIPIVLAEFEDGSRYIVTAPLPDTFLATRHQHQRRATGLRPYPVVENAFRSAVGELVVTGYQPMSLRSAPEVVTEPPIEEVVEVVTEGPEVDVSDPKLDVAPEPVHDVVVEGRAELVDVAPADEPIPNTLNDLKSMIDLINEEVAKMHRRGTIATLAVGEDGVLRGRVPVTRYVEL